MQIRNDKRTRQGLISHLWLIISLIVMASNLSAAPNKPSESSLKTSTKSKLNEIAKTPAKPVYANTITGANQAYKDRNFQDALKILIKLESAHAGKVRYDYLLGRCALETKQYDIAVAAFTRVLTVDPNFAAARFELARTFYSKGVAVLARGPFEQARSEFKLVAQMNPPPALKKAIDQYQSNIDKYLFIREAEFDIYVETMAGYDSNIGTAPETDSFTYYDQDFLTYRTYTIDKDKERQDSGITQIKAGFGMAWPLFSNDFEIFGHLELGARSYIHNSGYNHVWDKVSFGARHYGDENKKTIRLSFQKTSIFNEQNEEERYHDQGEFLLKWEVKNTQRNLLRIFLLGGSSNYEAHNTHVFSVEYNRQGIESVNLLSGKRKATIEVLFVQGEDHSQECEFGNSCPTAYERDVTGFRFGWGVNVFDSSRFYSSLFVESSEYSNNFFFQQRRDQRREFFIGMNTRFWDTWYIRPEVHYTRNESNIELFTHERWLTTVSLGWKI